MNPEEQKQPGIPPKNPAQNIEPKIIPGNSGAANIPTQDPIVSKYGEGAVRTYESDIARALSQKNVSLTKIAIAENVGKEKKAAQNAQSTEKNLQREIDGNFQPPQQSRYQTQAQYTPPQPSQPKRVAPLVQSPILPSSIEGAPRVGPSFEASPYQQQYSQPGYNQQNPSLQSIEIAPKQAPQSQAYSAQFTQRQQSIAQPPLIPQPAKPVQVPQVEEPEQVIRQTIRPPSHFLRNTVLFLISIILIGGGVYAGYYFYQQSLFSQTDTPIFSTPSVKGIIVSDKQKEFTTSSTTRQITLTQIVKEKNTLATTKAFTINTLEEILLTTPRGTGRSLIVAADVLSTIASNPPAPLLRSLAPQSMIGFIGTTAGPAPFAIFKSTYFQSTFTGMLGWEAKIFSDWQPLFITPTEAFPLVPIQEIEEPAVSTATSTATSTASSTPRSVPFISSEDYFNQGHHFEDLTYRNKDLRILKKGERIILLYSFIDKEHLVITTSLDAFDEILRRFEKETYIR